MGIESTVAKGQLIQLEDYDRTLGTDELNLAEFPLSSLTSRPEPGQNTLVFEDDIFDKGAGQVVHRSLVITGSAHFGLPTAIDNDVLLVLIHLSNVRNGLKQKRVEFSRYELVKFLGWDLGGKSYRRLDDSLQRWTSVTLHYKHAWWDSSGRRWRSRTFHVLESLELRGRDELADDGLSTFVWSDVIFDSFGAGNLKRIDLNTYFRLGSAIARQMFRFTDKRFHRASKLAFDLQTFACEHVGLSRSYDTFEIKRKLQPALEELEQIGFLTPMSVADRFTKLSPGKWQIHLVRQGAVPTDPPSEQPIVRELTRRGVSQAAATELATRFGPDHIAQKLDLHDRLLGAKDRRISQNPPGFLAAAIRHDYQDGKPPRPAKRATTRPRAASVRLVKHEADTKLETVREYVAQLSQPELLTLEAAAVANGSRLIVESYQRQKLQEGPLFEQVRLQLFANHLEREGFHRQQFTGTRTLKSPASRELEPVGSSIGDDDGGGQ